MNNNKKETAIRVISDLINDGLTINDISEIIAEINSKSKFLSLLDKKIKKIDMSSAMILNTTYTVLVKYNTSQESSHALLDDHIIQRSKVVEVANLEDLNNMFKHIVDVQLIESHNKILQLK